MKKRVFRYASIIYLLLLTLLPIIVKANKIQNDTGILDHANKSINRDALVAQVIARLGTSKIPELTDPQLEATLSLAELKEILMKIKEDLNTRISDLGNAADKDVIVKILQQRYNTVIEHIKQLQHFDSDEVNLYLSAKNANNEFTTIFKVTSSFIFTTTCVALLLASYNKDTGFTRPTKECFKQNCAAGSAWIKDFFSTSQPSL